MSAGLPDVTETLARHDFVWFAPQGARTALAVAPATRVGDGINRSVNDSIDDGAGASAADRARQLLMDWTQRGFPLIVARQCAASGLDRVRVGLALPPHLGKLRLAFLMERCHLIRREPPPSLQAIGAAAPAHWLPLLEQLTGDPAVQATRPRVTGSAAMTMLTGLECVGPESDLDLLMTPGSWDAALECVRALERMGAACPVPRLDGELLAPDGSAVAWREFAAQPARVLVKDAGAVRLEEAATLRRRFLAAHSLQAA